MRTRKQAAGQATELVDALVGGNIEQVAASAREAAAAIPEDAQTYRAGPVRPPEPPPPAAPPSPPAPGLRFVTANGAAPGEISPDYARIVETLYAADAASDYEDLERNLVVGEDRGDYVTLRKALDEAEARARKAHQILLGAKIEEVRWTASSKRIWANMRDTARQQLEAEKEEGTRKKQATIEEVDERIAEIFADEYLHHAETKAKLKGMIESLEHLVTRWNAKCGDLKTLLETLRK